MWSLRAERGEEILEEQIHRQGTAYRWARRLHASGYSITAVQLSIDEPPQPLGVYQFDGIRFVRIPPVR